MLAAGQRRRDRLDGGVEQELRPSPAARDRLPPPAALALAFAIAAVPLLFSAAKRRLGLVVIAASLLVALPHPYAMRAGYVARMAGFPAFVERSQPLIDAIRAYEAQHGEPPAALGDLVPELLPAVPETGIGPSPAYRYSVAGSKRVRFVRERWVPCSSGFLNWDEMLCFESESYPAAFGNSAGLEPIGNWAYVHE